MKAKKNPKPELPEIHCPGCGQRVEYTITVIPGSATTDGNAILVLRPQLDPHTCPPGLGLPLEVAA